MNGVTARIDANSRELFERNRIRVLASYVDGRTETVIGRGPDGSEYQYVYGLGGPDPEVPEGGSLFAFEASRDVAHAVYLALKGHFEAKDPMPTASDRAYADARTDIDRQHALIETLVGAATRPPIVINGETVATTQIKDVV